MRIGALARRTGVSVRLLRYYEEQGLLAPTRRSSGYPEYTGADVDTVRRIRALLAAGLNTRVIGRVLPCLADDPDRIVPTCPELVDILRVERDRIAASISQLQGTQRILDSAITAAIP
jgi:DNA-binding transcriptional MerR regulator